MKMRIATAVLLAWLGAAACTGTIDAHEGFRDARGVSEVGIELNAAAGLDFEAIEYTVTRTDGFNLYGELDTTGVSGEIRALLVLPIATEYTITLRATTRSGSHCEGSSGFDVTGHGSAHVEVSMRCGGEEQHGSVLITGTLNVCPEIEQVVATPLTPLAEHRVYALRAEGHDADGRPSELHYTWSASAGALENAVAPQTRYRCGDALKTTIALVITDGDHGCPPATIALPLDCSAPPSPDDDDAGTP